MISELTQEDYTTVVTVFLNFSGYEQISEQFFSELLQIRGNARVSFQKSSELEKFFSAKYDLKHLLNQFYQFDFVLGKGLVMRLKNWKEDIGQLVRHIFKK